jgi:four helix bundle protein
VGDNTVSLGDFKLTVVSDGYFWLDGGSMFGVVPKVLWNKLVPADEMNRVRLAVNTLLIQGSGKTVLVDTGLGKEIDDKLREIYSVERPVDLMEQLHNLGLKDYDIDFVINTHLHFDHAGWNTVRKKNNKKYVPAFPRAEYIIQKNEWHDANNPNERTRASYNKKNFTALEGSGQLQLVQGDHAVFEGVTVLNTTGHTEGHQSVLVESRGRKAIWLGDLMPTAAHVRIPYLTGFDLFPLDIIEQKKKILNQAIKEHWLLIFQHDPKVIFAYLEEESGKQNLRPIDCINSNNQIPNSASCHNFGMGHKQFPINQKQNYKPYDLAERTLQFAKNVMSFIKPLSKTQCNIENIKQLIRSSGSVGANYIEANESLSKKDFLMRLKICRKESKESAYWLKLIECDEIQNGAVRKDLIDEATQLVKIFNSIIEKSN